MSEIPNLTDIIDAEPSLEGDKTPIDTVLNIPVTVTGWRISKSKYSGEVAIIQFRINDGEPRVVFTGSQVIISQLRQVEESIGHNLFRTTVKKVGKYYKLF